MTYACSLVVPSQGGNRMGAQDTTHHAAEQAFFKPTTLSLEVPITRGFLANARGFLSNAPHFYIRSRNRDDRLICPLSPPSPPRQRGEGGRGDEGYTSSHPHSPRHLRAFCIISFILSRSPAFSILPSNSIVASSSNAERACIKGAYKASDGLSSAKKLTVSVRSGPAWKSTASRAFALLSRFNQPR